MNNSPTHAHQTLRNQLRRLSIAPRTNERDTAGSSSSEQDAAPSSWLRLGVVPHDYPDPVAADWPELLEIVERLVKPQRDDDNRENYRRLWWQFGEKQARTRTSACRAFPKQLCGLQSEHPHLGVSPICPQKLSALIRLISSQCRRFRQHFACSNPVPTRSGRASWLHP